MSFISKLLIAAILLMWATPALAGRSDLPCYSGSLEHKARCLAERPGLHPRGGTAYALGVLDCEGGIDLAPQRRSHYVGPWSLTPDEARVFPKQAPREWWLRVRDLGPANGYRQTVGVFAHSQKHGWGWSSCR